MVFDINGNPLVTVAGGTTNILVGAVLDASSDANRFVAMKQLFDIAKKKIDDPAAVISDSEFTAASKGAVCLLPYGDAAMYEKFPFDFLYKKAETTQAVPASVTKVMSFVTGLDYVRNLGEVITIVSSDLEGGSGAYFSAGDTMTLQEVMLSMALPSSNTAAKAWARICGAKMLEAEGDSTYTEAECRTKFIAMMNAKAAYIGMENSTFDTPSGASSNTKSTVSDLVRLTVEACSYPQILKVWNKKSYTISVGGTNPRSVTLTTTVTNTTLENSYYIFGGKTGALTSPLAEALVMVAKPK